MEDGGSESWWTKIYLRILRFALWHRLLVIFLTLVLFAGSYYLFDKYVTKGRIWSWGQDTYLVVFIRMPGGAELERTDAIVRNFEQRLVAYPKIDKIYANVTPEYARIEITFPREVQLTAFPLILKEELTNMAVQIAGPNVGVYGFGPGFYTGGGAAPQFRLQVLGYNYNEIKRIAQNVGRILQRNPRVREVNTDAAFWWGQEDLFEMVLQLEREKLKRFQMTPAEVLDAVQSYLRETLSWQRIKLAGREIDYRIKM